MEDDVASGYDEALETGDLSDAELDLGDAVQDGTSNTITGKGGDRS
jgi:hypothetical protein